MSREIDVPEVVYEKNGRIILARCSACGNYFAVENSLEEPVVRQDNYCWNCGQKQDWVAAIGEVFSHVRGNKNRPLSWEELDKIEGGICYIEYSKKDIFGVDIFPVELSAKDEVTLYFVRIGRFFQECETEDSLNKVWRIWDHEPSEEERKYPWLVR